MKKALIFAGTTEGRRLAEHLAREGIPVEVCVATEYGEQVIKGDEGIKIHQGRLSVEDMRKLYDQGDYFAIVDGTHPFATQVTKNILESIKGYEIPFFRISREWEEKEPAEYLAQGNSKEHQSVIRYENAEDCAKALEEGTAYERILLTTGSKELALFCRTEELKKKLVVRVLPGRESMETCWKLGLEGRQIIAMQGASTMEMNLAVIRQYGIDALVTKESGRIGGEGEKVRAAAEAGIPCLMIKRPAEQKAGEVLSEEEAFRAVMGLVVKKRQVVSGKTAFHIVLAGAGMGNEASMTRELQNALDETDYLFGASRLLEGVKCRGEKYPYYLAKDIIPKLKELREKEPNWLGEKTVTILFSGDSGFYSGCGKVRNALQEMENIRITVLPGISSIAAFSAKIGEEWQDALILSAHGVAWESWSAKMLHGCRQGKKIFLLTSGPEDVQRIGELLMEAGLSGYEVSVGFQIDYPQERIFVLKPEECAEVKDKGLYVVMLLPGEDKKVNKVALTPSFTDDAFIRGSVPMTKEEVRGLSICKLRLSEGAVVYDIGSGTGSVAVQMAALSGDVRVYAIEQAAEGVALTEQNRAHFGLQNLKVIEGMAPEALETLPIPTHAFIGGSKGRLREILDTLYRKNPRMRIVINAVSLEGIAQTQELLEKYPLEDLDIVTVQVSKAKKAGDYHLMMANNPVTIFSFTFQGQSG